MSEVRTTKSHKGGSVCEVVSPQKGDIPTPQQIEAYEESPKKISKVVEGLSKSQLHYKMSDEEWTINQVLAHLADIDMIFCERIKAILAEETPTLPSFNQDSWADNLYYNRQNPKLSLEILFLIRKMTADLLRNLESEAWTRKGIKGVEELNVFDILLKAIKHIDTHLGQIEKIKQSPNFPKAK